MDPADPKNSMATTSLWPIYNTSSRTARAVVKQLVEYAENEEKTKANLAAAPSMEQGIRPDQEENRPPEEALSSVMSYVSDKNEGLQYVTGINCSSDKAVDEMMITKRRFRTRGNRILYHGYQSFLPGEVTPDQAHRIGEQLARSLWGDRFEVVVATHLDREHLHNHFVINSVSFSDGKKFDWNKEYPRMQKLSDQLCKTEGLSVVQSGNRDANHHRGAKRATEEGKYTIESILKEDVDRCIYSSRSIEEWMALMRSKGYRIDTSGKYLRVYPYGHSRCIRIDRRFGSSYTLDGIEWMINNTEFIPVDAPSEKEDAAIEPSKLQEIFQDFQYARKPDYPYRQPSGLQIKYAAFLFRMGWRKTAAQVTVTHYLIREELTKLDRYTNEIRFLIREDIQTTEELSSRQKEYDSELKTVVAEQRRLRNRIRRCNPEEKAALTEQLQGLNDQAKNLRRNLWYCKDIGERSKSMDRKVTMIEKMDQQEYVDPVRRKQIDQEAEEWKE